MNHPNHKRCRGLLLVLFSTMVLPLSAGTPLELRRASLDGGGGESINGDFLLRATVGQPDAGRLSDGSFLLQAGFWVSGTAPPNDEIFKNGFE
jgi:hypothetical protein